MRKSAPLNYVVTSMAIFAAIGIVILVLFPNFPMILGGRGSDSSDEASAPTLFEVFGEPSLQMKGSGATPYLLDVVEQPVSLEESAIPGWSGAPEWTNEALSPTIQALKPQPVEGTAPDTMLTSSEIMVDEHIVDSFSSPERIDFDIGEAYALVEGITTFRGNNFRDGASYGAADIKDKRFGDKWSLNTGSFTAPDGAYWSGHGWTGQPHIVKWPKQTREIMNMYGWAREQDNLVEVIYPSMDGYIYFSELETGAATRDKLYLGFPFKGCGAIDPRGYPVLYIGAGYGGAEGAARIFIVSLIDGSILYTFGYSDDFAPRGWTAADAAPLVSVETDQLIYPSENGVIYIIKLNSEFNPETRNITIAPSVVKWRFRGKRSQSGGKYWLGMEDSPAIWRGHLFIADNGGHLVCLDLNTLEPVWVQDTLDDTNGSPVLELEDGHPYIYIGTSFHEGWRARKGSKAIIPVWKIDAITGEIVWQTDYSCYTTNGMSGGVQATAALGKHDLSELVYVPFARTPTKNAGILTALNKQSGEIVWELHTDHYAWSSPVCVYDQDGKGYIVFCASSGSMYLLDGSTGEVLDSIELGGNIEASPAIYENTVVVGTRGMKIWGIKLS
ncbi:MAG: PQQ-binding-like beta-propeller repeat protein [Oscillospiraceae bacterium]|nr:PQQ-binding-like beta-propeller repeat protein [Oscillospiraceae bacterium]